MPSALSARWTAGVFLALIMAAAGLVGPATAWAQRAAGPRSEVPPPHVAPNLRFQHLTNEDGLSLNLVRAMIQDRRGFMWFGSEDGLNRYDGYTFTVYESVPFDSTSLLDDNITALAEDQEGALWIGTSTGLSRLDPHTGRFHHYRHDPRDPTSIPLGSVTALAVEPSRIVWVGLFRGGLSRFDPDTEQFRHYRHDPRDAASLSSNMVRALYRDAEGALWVGTTNGLNRLDPRTSPGTSGAFRRFLYDPAGLGPDESVPVLTAAPAAVRAGFVLAVCSDPAERGVMWVGTGAGLVRLDARTGEARRFTPDPARPDGNVVTALLPDPRTPGVLWVASREGLYHFAIHGGRFTPYRHDPDNPNSISGDALQGLVADRTGLLWVQTNVEGIERFDPAGTAFFHGRFVPESGRVTGSGASGRGLAEDAAGRLWFTSGGSLAWLDRATGVYTPFRDPRAPSDFVDDYNMYQDRAGALWLGGNGRVFRIIPSETAGAEGVARDFTTFALEPGQSLVRAFAFYEDRAGVLWAGGVAGLSRLDAAGRVFRRVPLIQPSGGEMEAPVVKALFEDAAGAFWAGTGVGLLRIDRATGVVTAYGHDPRDPASLATDVVYAIHERAHEPGILWLGTTDGLDRFDTRTGRTTHFTVADGLPNGTIWALLEDERGHLWMSTNNGLSDFDPERRTFTNYGTDAGVQSREFNLGGAYRSPRTGELFFAGINGFNAFFPSRITRNPHPPAVVLTGLRIANHPVAVSADGPLRVPMEEAEEVRLRPSERTVTFEFVGLHYQNPAQNRYAYRLDGFDEAWVDAGTERTATYTNLDPGTYTFRVRAASSDGVWNEEGTSVRLVVLPAWWQTAWARLAGVLALIGLVGGVYRWRTAQVRAHNETLRAEVAQQTLALTEANGRLREVDRRRRDFFANVSHEFRTPLTLILGPLDDLRARLVRTGGDSEGREATREELTTTLDVARYNARRLLRLINQLLDAARLEDGALRLNPRPGDLARLVAEVGAAFAGLAERRGVTFRIAGADAPLEAAFDADAVEKVLANLLSNAFKFTPPGGTVELRMGRAERDGRALAAVAVHDTGPGIAEEALAHVFERFYQVDEAGGVGTGIGLALAKELAELHGGAVEVESVVGSGSVFTLLLPLEEAAPAPPVGSAAHEARMEARAAAEMLEPDGGDPRWTPDAVPELSALRVQGDGLLFDADLAAVAEEAAREAAEAEAGRPLVLVVDDHAEIRAYVGRHLRPRYRVVEAADGREALRKAREHPPDVILSDVMMPGLDGLALLRALKADPETDFVPVVLLTARAAVEDRLEGLHAQADDYLTKPFEVAELVARIENLIAGRRRLRARLARETAVAVDPPGAMPAGSPTTTLHAAPVAVASADAVFLERVRQAVEEHMGEPAFGVEALADAVGMSRVHLFRRLRELCGETPSALLQRMRLERAAALLVARAGSVSEVAYGVGFRSVAHFSKAFRARYGTTPGTYTERTHTA